MVEEICYVCVDLEASGPVPGLYSMLSLGAVCIEEDPGGPRPGPSLYLELRPLPEAGVDPGAMSVHDLDLETLEREGMEPRRALERCSEWVTTHADGREPVFVGHNAPFDWSFINWYHHRFEVANPFGYKALDTKALAMGVLGIPWLETHKERLSRELEGLSPEDRTRKHRADYDAAYQAEILCALLRRMERDA